MGSIESTVTIYVDGQGPFATISFSSCNETVSVTVSEGEGEQSRSSTGYSDAAGLRELAFQLVRLAEFTEAAK